MGSTLFQIVTSGYNKVLKELNVDIKGNVHDVLDKHGRKIETKAKEIITRKAFRTGYLRSQTYYRVAPFELYIGNRAEYASYVFFGTYKMPARPCLREAIEWDREQLLKDLDKATKPGG